MEIEKHPLEGMLHAGEGIEYDFSEKSIEEAILAIQRCPPSLSRDALDIFEIQALIKRAKKHRKPNEPRVVYYYGVPYCY